MKYISGLMLKPHSWKYLIVFIDQIYNSMYNSEKYKNKWKNTSNLLHIAHVSQYMFTYKRDYSILMLGHIYLDPVINNLLLCFCYKMCKSKLHLHRVFRGRQLVKANNRQQHKKLKCIHVASVILFPAAPRQFQHQLPYSI